MLSFSRVLSVLSVLLIAGPLLGPPSTYAQLQEVRQTVFGMDCAPCAHAMETRLGNVEDVSDVTVSLNEGLATITLAPENTLTLAALREAVVKAGFQPKDATVRLTGVVEEQEGRLLLSTSAGETYVLDPPEDGSLQELEPGARVTVTGRIPPDTEQNSSGWPTQVQQIEPTG